MYLDNSYCLWQLELLQTLSPFVAHEPPQMFQIISVTTTNIRFSWQEPAVLNGILTGYNLSCQPVLPANIATPPILSTGPTVNTALFPNLSPGVGYNCSIVASNSAGSSDPVHAVGTTTETGIRLYTWLYKYNYII